MRQKISDNVCNYFVDEAGDAVIFGKKKATRIGTHGASRFFFIGLLKVDNPDKLSYDLDEFRKKLLADPKLNKLHCMQPENNQTFIKFHATDDHPTIRKAVYKFLQNYDGLKFTCVLKDKKVVYTYVSQRKMSDPTYHYSHVELYDHCIRRVFRDRLHLHKTYEITFAKWNKAERYRELTKALLDAKERFYNVHEIKVDNTIKISCKLPQSIGGLQVADYYLWAVQRMYEKQDDSYYKIVKERYSLIVDVDDTSKQAYGMYYDKTKPLTLGKVRGRL